VNGVADKAGTKPNAKVGRGASAPAPRAPRRTASGATTYTVDRPQKAGPVEIALKIALTLVFVATVVLCAHRAATLGATPHTHVPDVLVTAGFVATGVAAAILAVAGIFWVVRGARFADNLAFAVLWPIATVLMVIAAGAAAVPQHYLRVGLMLTPAGLAAAAMMIAVAWVYNRAPGR
jgi:hypothetical protein